MKPIVLLDSEYLDLILNRLSHQLVENHDDFQNTVILGIQPRGEQLAQRICHKLKEIAPDADITHGSLDITFYRDDFRRRDQPLNPNSMNMPFIIEDKKVVMIDDVLYTGRTIRAALDAMLSYGRPKSVELLVLIDRRFSRELPIEPNYVGKAVDSLDEQRVTVEWTDTGHKKDRVVLHITQTDE